MPAEMSFSFDQSDVDRLNNRMLAVSGLSKRSMRAVTWVTAKKLAWNLYRNTAMAQKTQKVKRPYGDKVWALIVPKWASGGRVFKKKTRQVSLGEGYKYGGMYMWLPVSISTANRYGYYLRNEGKIGKANYDQNGNLRVRGRGYARAAWLAIMARMGWASGTKQSSSARKWSDDLITQDETGAVSAIEMANQIPYIGAMDQGLNGNPPGNILSRSIQATIGELEKDMKRIARNLEMSYV